MNSSDVWPKIELWRGDITTLAVDAIVNAANQTLLGGGGVDGAIHHAAGPRLIEHCRTLNGCKTGEAKITRGFDLPARFVIHTVGPVYHGGGQGEAELLASCYRRSLQIAADKGLRTIAFPAISTGVFGYPFEAATEIALTTSFDFLQSESSVEQVTFIFFGDADYESARGIRLRLLPGAETSVLGIVRTRG